MLEMNGSMRYWQNLGGGKFDLPRPMRAAPPYGLSDPGVQMIDANGDGRADLLVTTAETAGYYPLDETKALRRAVSRKSAIRQMNHYLVEDQR